MSLGGQLWVDQRRWAIQSGSVKLEWEQGVINALCGIVGGWEIELATFLCCVVVPNLSDFLWLYPPDFTD